MKGSRAPWRNGYSKTREGNTEDEPEDSYSANKGGSAQKSHNNGCMSKGPRSQLKEL